MINATHFVLDLETMGNRPSSAIVAIGCVRIENLAITGEFYRRVALASSLKVGLTTDASTINWWLQQDEDARKEITGEGANLFEALLDLCEFIGADAYGKPNQAALLWGNGCSFDNVIIGNAFDAHRLERPWCFWNDRDMRTLLAIFPKAKQLAFEGTKHHALNDAKHEANQLLSVLQSMAEAEEETRV